MSVYDIELDVSLPPEDDLKFLDCCVLSENLPQFGFGEFASHLLERNILQILNGPTSRNPVDRSQASMQARQLVHPYLSTGHEIFDYGTCWQRG
jgi:hypothetical protein